jgi:hypothetical protein
MRENRTRTKLIQGKAVLGIISPVSDPMIAEAIEIIRAAGLFVGITANTGEAAVTQIARGAQIVLNSLPGLLSQGSQAFLDVARQDQATA